VGDCETVVFTVDGEHNGCDHLQIIAQIFKDATLFFSRLTPNIPTVLPAMDHIDEWLTTASVNSKLPTSICMAASLSKKTLNQYYKHSDCSKVYRIAMGMYFGSMYSMIH